jgi:hypothetical protein
MASVVMPRVVKLSIVLLSASLTCVVMLSVVVLSHVAPVQKHFALFPLIYSD